MTGILWFYKLGCPLRKYSKVSDIVLVTISGFIGGKIVDRMYVVIRLETRGGLQDT